MSIPSDPAISLPGNYTKEIIWKVCKDLCKYFFHQSIAYNKEKWETIYMFINKVISYQFAIKKAPQNLVTSTVTISSANELWVGKLGRV